MKVNKLQSKYVLKKTLGYKFIMYHHLDINNNDRFTLTVLNRTLKIKEHVLLTNPTYIVGMFDAKIREYMFNVIEQSINLKIYSLDLDDVLYVEKCANSFIIHKVDSVFYEQVYYEGYDKLYSNLEDAVTQYKKLFLATNMRTKH